MDSCQFCRKDARVNVEGVLCCASHATQLLTLARSLALAEVEIRTRALVSRAAGLMKGVLNAA